MGIVALLLTAVSLSMDAFAVAVCKGLSMKRLTLRGMLTVGLWFGVFQGLMPTIGFFLGRLFEKQITAIDHWIAFLLLALIGFNMIREALSGEDECRDCTENPLAVKSMLPLAVATSIDALAVGIVFALKGPDTIGLSAAIIGVTTCALSAIGVRVGNVFGTRYKSRAELAGGVILILLGVKILIDDLANLNLPI